MICGTPIFRNANCEDAVPSAFHLQGAGKALERSMWSGYRGPLNP